MDAKPTVYLFYGDDTFAIGRAVDGMLAKMGDPGLADLNTARLDGRAVSEEDLRMAVSSIPFLAERRLVVLTNPLARAGGKEGQRRFTALLDTLPPTTALVLTQEDHREWKGGSFDWRTLKDSHWLVQWVRAAAGRALARVFELPGPRQMPGWISAQAREKGGQFVPGAAQALADLTGSDTRVASLEIDKLLLYVNFARPVEPEDVAECCAAVVSPSAFDLLDALGARDKPGALRLLRALLDDGEAMSVFGLIVSHFRALILAREALSQGGGLNEVMQVTGRPKSVAGKLLQQAGGFAPERLAELYRRLERMDFEMKNGTMPVDLALELLIVEL